MRRKIWELLAGPWHPDCLETVAQFTTLENLAVPIADILAGRIHGRVVVRME